MVKKIEREVLFNRLAADEKEISGLRLAVSKLTTENGEIRSRLCALEQMQGGHDYAIEKLQRDTKNLFQWLGKEAQQLGWLLDRFRLIGDEIGKRETVKSSDAAR